MTNKEYIRLAMLTESTLDPLKYEIGKNEMNVNLPWSAKRGAYSRLLHSTLGCADEAGELVKNIKDRLFYGKPLNATNLKEEYGDLLWYIALGIDALGTSFEEIMKLNIAKLRARYPDKFTEDAAINRNLEAERKALETLFWEGCSITTCQVCHKSIGKRFIDGRLTYSKSQLLASGPWAILCPACYTTYGIGLGEGKGQLYELQGERYVKVDAAEMQEDRE